MKLRPYQRSAFDAVLAAFRNGHRSALVQLPTGCGKTIVFAELVRSFERRGLGRAMVLAHTRELIDQAADKIGVVTGYRPEIEMADQYSTEHGIWRKNHCVVSSIQTQSRGRMERFDPGHFGLLVIDEAHRAVSPTYRQAIEYYTQNPELKVLHVTATPDRLDGVGLGSVVDKVAYQYEIRDAIEDGWLVPIRQRIVRSGDIDYSGVRTSKGDFTAADLQRVMVEEKPLHAIAHPTFKLAEKRKTLVFAAGVEHAQKLAEILNRHRPGCADYVHGKQHKDDRKEILKKYSEGGIQFLCNAQVLIEGYDEPSIEMVVVARATQSRARYTQMLGRGTRALAGVVDRFDTADERRAAIEFSPKPNLLVLDFAGNAGKHQLMTAADILAGDAPPEVIGRAKELAEDGEGDVMDVLDDAAEQLERERLQKEEEMRREQERRRARLRGEAKFQVEDVNPFSVALQRAQRGMSGDFMEADKPTQKQIKQLRTRGVSTDKLTRKQASLLMGQLANNGWRTPADWRGKWIKS